MAEFLTTSSISARLEEIIKQAKKRLVIISPYLKVNDRIKGFIEGKAHEGKIYIDIVYRKDSKNKELQTSESAWLKKLSSIKTTLVPNLHAKCYLNEEQAIITSMNLYEFSQQSNHEMGILVSKKDDLKLYEKINEEIREIFRHGKEVNLSASAKTPTYSDPVPSIVPPSQASPSLKRKTATPTLERPSSAQCIRCGDKMPEANENKPLCLKDWRSWNQSKKDDYPGKFCHFCGKKYKTAKNRPLCINCYRKYEGILEL